MEIRCGKCDKLFRVADEKIAGAGIKFSCTRCGEAVKITKQDYEQHTLSRAAVSVLDMFDPASKPPKAPLSAPAGEAGAPATSPAAQEPKPFDFSMPFGDEVNEDKTGTSFSEPDAISASLSMRDFTPPAAQEQPSAAAPETAFAAEPEPDHWSRPMREPEPQKTAAPLPEEMPRPEPGPQAAPLPESLVGPVATEHEEKLSAEQDGEGASSEVIPEAAPPQGKPSHSGRMLLVLLVALFIGGLAIYGVFTRLQAPPQETREAVPELTSVAGLRIISPAGVMQENGDLLVSGSIGNSTEKEITAWYVVVDVYDAQNTALAKLRLLNGKQIYTRRDFDVLAQRGVNVQELKAKYLQDPGVVILPKGTVSFELRYVQPVEGIASFLPFLVPFDPVRLHKEISEELR